MQDYFSSSKTSHCSNYWTVLFCGNQHASNTIKDALPVQSSWYFKGEGQWQKNSIFVKIMKILFDALVFMF